jgi:hypothetical protein
VRLPIPQTSILHPMVNSGSSKKDGKTVAAIENAFC